MSYLKSFLAVLVLAGLGLYYPSASFAACCKTSTGACSCTFSACSLTNPVCYSTTSTSSTTFTLSGPLTTCQFFRPDRPEDVLVNVDSAAFQGIVDTGPQPVRLSGLAVCGITDPDGVLRNFAFFNVNDVTFGCASRTVSGNTARYTELFSDLDVDTLCPDGVTAPVSGSFTGNDSYPVVGNIDTMLTYCSDGDPTTGKVGTLANCTLNVGIEAGVKTQYFDKKVCPKDPSTGRTVNGQIFAFTESLVNGSWRPGKIGACYCDSDLNGGPATCGTPSTGEPIKTNAPAAAACEFDWQKTGTESGDTINLSGSPSQVNAAIYDSPDCPVSEIVQKTVRVCNDVTPRNFKIQTDQGRLALTFQITEGDCATSLANLTPGESRLIYAVGAFNDTNRFEGADDVTVVLGP